MIKKEFYKDFKPELSPKKMLELGVFGGSYFGSNIKEYPKLWFKKAKLSKNFDVSLNCFRVESGLSRNHWIKKGWIFKYMSMNLCLLWKTQKILEGRLRDLTLKICFLKIKRIIFFFLVVTKMQKST